MSRKHRKGDDEAEHDFDRKEYFDERRLLIEARQRNYQRADQMVTAGATASIVLSVTFLEKATPGAIAALPLLVTAWIVLLVSMATGLAGQFLSGRAFTCEIERLNGSHKGRNHWNHWNTRCGITAAVTLVTGLGVLIAFAYINLVARR